MFGSKHVLYNVNNNQPGRYYVGVSMSSTSDKYTTAVSGGISGNNSGFSIWGLLSVNSQTVTSANRRVFTKSNFTNQGWQLIASSTNALLTFWVYNGAGSQVLSQTYTITANDLGKPLHACLVFNGTQLLFYVNGQMVSTAVACAGFTSSSAGQTFGSTTNPDGILLIGIAGGDSTLTPDEVMTNYQDSLAAKNVVAIPGKTTHLYSIKNQTSTVAPNNIVDSVGSDNMTKSGSPTLYYL